MTTSVNSDTAGYFFTPALKGLAQQLVHLTFFGDGLSVVIGPLGAGKSALASEIISHLGQAHDIASINLTAELDLADCLELVSESLGISASSAVTVGEMLAELRHYVQALTQEKKLVVVVIDDAHFLDDQAIGALVSLLQGRFESNVGLHLILFSEPGLDSRIDALQIVDVAVYDFSLPNFSPSELASFLSMRREGDALGSAEVQRIWASSKGFPGPALDCISGGSNSGDEKSESKRGIPLAHIAAIVVLGAVLVWSLTSRQASEKNVIGDAARPTTIEAAQNIDEEPDKNESVTGEKILDVAKQRPAVELDSEHPERKRAVSAMPMEVLQASDSGQIVEEEAGSPVEAVSSISEASPPPSVPKRTDTPKQIVAAPSPVPSSSPNVPRIINSLSDSEAFLMGQDSEHYVLQVIAASNESSLNDYILRQTNKDSLRMYRGTREGKSWFVIVQGVYKTRNMALDARENLPNEQAKAGPWPRKISSIKEEIETYRLN